MTATAFIQRWQNSGGAELANSQSFLKELCTLLDVPQPDPTEADEDRNAYVFEKAVLFNNGDGTTSAGRVDLYRQGCYVLESKQGVERKAAEQAELLATKSKQKKIRSGTASRGTPGWEQAMTKARQQVRRYAEALPGEWPPFLIVADVGYCFDLYADFAQAGKNYIPFPDPQSYRIYLADLEDEQVRQMLRAIWLDPLSLDPSRRSAKVTRDVAQRLARLAKSLEPVHTAEVVAQFLMRCLFTMFAEDVEIGGLKKGDFTKFLSGRRGKLATFVPMLQQLWQDMNTGGFSVILEGQIMQFNGGLFEDCTALPVSEDQLELLIEAAEARWTDVEPAIFGTLLERALDPVERHKLGAHYTPRAYVERLVMPTIIEPLREQWDTVYATAVLQYEAGQISDAVKSVRQFHEQLCETRVLDPACGSGNFLYVALELMKRLEGEVLKALRDFGDRQTVLLTIDPHQFLGMEVNPRAAAITDLVLWIGYLQWHVRSRGGDDLREPIIRKFHNIECRDAVLAWDRVEPVADEAGNPVTRWDGRTTKTHPVTGEEVPDETARVQELRYVNPRKAEWPQADYIVGNPPFVGDKMMKTAMGYGYVNTLRSTYKELGGSADYVMYWWNNAAENVLGGISRRFGFIATNSLKQNYNRRTIARHMAAKPPLSLFYAIPDHPWVDSTDGADVRISLTVAVSGSSSGRLLCVESERRDREMPELTFRETSGRIGPDLTIGADVAGAVVLRANTDVSCPGVKLFGQGFVVSPFEAEQLGLREIPSAEKYIRPYLIAREFTQTGKGRFVLDFLGLDSQELRERFPACYQWLLDRVKPERDQNNRASYRKWWWLFGEPRKKFRKSFLGIKRQIVTAETSKHRMFTFVPIETVAEGTLVIVALDDAYFLGVLSSRIHVVWALATGGRLGVGNDPRYNKTRCFETFPFPDPDEALKARIRSLGEQLDAHRKRQQELYPTLTMTGMYNVLEKLRAGEALSAKEKVIHEQGLVSVLKQIHDDLDAAVAAAYGWPVDLSDEEILQRLVDLNAERAAEEARGVVRWLRPEFQNPARSGAGATQKKLAMEDDLAMEDGPAVAAVAVKVEKQPWPASVTERFTAVRTALAQQAAPATAADMAKHFKGGRVKSVEELLDLMVSIGQARQTDDGRYVA